MSGFIAKIKGDVHAKERPIVEFFMEVDEDDGDINIGCNFPGEEDDYLFAWISSRSGALHLDAFESDRLRKYGLAVGDNGAIEVQ